MQAVRRCNVCRCLGYVARFGGQHLCLGPVAGLFGLDLRHELEHELFSESEHEF